MLNLRTPWVHTATITGAQHLNHANEGEKKHGNGEKDSHGVKIRSLKAASGEASLQHDTVVDIDEKLYHGERAEFKATGDDGCRNANT